MINGDTLRKLREKNGPTQAELARRLSITRQSVAAIETPGPVWPTTALRYLRALYGPGTTMQVDVFVDGECILSDVVEES